MSIVELVCEHYSLGYVKEVSELRCGPGSIVWRLDCERNGLSSSFCLKDHKTKPLERLQFEHAVASRMPDFGFSLIPNVIPSTSRNTIVSLDEHSYSLYEFIGGDPVFDWTKGGWTVPQCESAGTVLAQFHSAGLNMLDSSMPRKFAGPASGQALLEWAYMVLKFGAWLPDEMRISLANCEELVRSAFSVTADEDGMALIHGDFHPGNLVFRGTDIAAVLDIDYCRRDSRLFDVAYAATAFSLESLDHAYARVFLNSYNRTVLNSSNLGGGKQLDFVSLQPVLRLSAWLIAVWVVEHCQTAGAERERLLPVIRRCIAILSASFD